MAKYKSKYPELSFYVDTERKKFSNGVFETNVKKEIDVLESLIDAVRVDEPKQEPKKVEEKPKPTTKRANTRKSSTK